MSIGLCDFHPRQLAFVGFSNAGKTTLLERVIRSLGQHYRLGFAKHDAHHFKLDHDGKDTDRMRRAGAKRIWISNDQQTGQYGDNHHVLPAFQFQDCDAVLVEGHKQSPFPKIAFLDSTGMMNERIQNGGCENVVATIGAEPVHATAGRPHFQRNDINAVITFVESFLFGRERVPPLHGLVLSDGQLMPVSRDQSGTASNVYAQPEKTYRLLATVCERVFVSCPYESGRRCPLPWIENRFLKMGVIGQICSALESAPEAAWLVAASHLPRAHSETVSQLICQRHPWALATTYTDPDNGQPDPRLTIYEPAIKLVLYQFLGLGVRSPQHILLNCYHKALHIDGHPTCSV